MDKKIKGVCLALLASVAPAAATAAVSIDLYRSSAGSQERDVYLSGLAGGVLNLNVATEMMGKPRVFCPPSEINNVTQFAQRVIDRALMENAANMPGSQDVSAVFVAGLVKQCPCR